MQPRDPAFGEMWALIHSEQLLSTRLGMLRLQLSDSSLTQMPEFEQRVVALQKLQYVSLDRTVLLKVRLEMKTTTCIVCLRLTKDFFVAVCL